MGKVLTEGERKVPVFTDAQLEYLNKVFPESTNYTSDSNSLQYHRGTRAVVKHIEHQINMSRR